MYLLAKLGGHRSYGNGYINSNINSYMNTSEKAEVAALVRNIEGFSKSAIRFCNYEVSDKAGRKTRIHAFVKHYAFHANAINSIIISEQTS